MKKLSALVIMGLFIAPLAFAADRERGSRGTDTPPPPPVTTTTNDETPKPPQIKFNSTSQGSINSSTDASHNSGGNQGGSVTTGDQEGSVTTTNTQGTNTTIITGDPSEPIPTTPGGTTPPAGGCDPRGCVTRSR